MPKFFCIQTLFFSSNLGILEPGAHMLTSSMWCSCVGSYCKFLYYSFDDTNRRFVRRIQESEVREVLKRMKEGRAMGPDGIPIKVWRCLGDIAIV